MKKPGYAGKKWMSDGGVYHNTTPGKGTYPRYGTIFQVASYKPRTATKDLTFWELDKKTKAPVRKVKTASKTVMILKFKVTQKAPPKNLPREVDDLPQVNFTKQYAAAFQSAEFVEVGDVFVTPPIAVGKNNTITFIVQFSKDYKLMIQSAYSQGGYVGGYCCPGV